MGQCASVPAPALPMLEGLAEVVDGLVKEVFGNYFTFVRKYTTGMKEKAGGPFVCEEVLDPATKSGKSRSTRL
jgi:hypothetical protein